MDADDLPSPFIKKRTKGIRPSGSSSALRSLAGSPSASTSNLSFANDDGDDADEGGNVAVIRMRGKKTAAGRVQDREGGSSKPKSRLSFGGGEEEDEDGDTSFSIKRTESPRRLLRASGSSASLRADSLPQSLDQASISPAPSPARSVYSKEYLNQLKATTNSTPSRASEYDELTRSKFGASLGDMPSAIPTSAAIAEAREKRERMRAEGGGTGSDAFISLEVGMVTSGGESRLVREEDELGDGDEDMAEFTGAQESIPLGKKANREAAKKLRTGMIDMIHDAEEEEDDEEAREWELAQIRRGEQGRDTMMQTPSKRPYKPAAIPTPSTLPSLTGLSARLATALSTLKVSHTMDAAALTHFEHERAELAAQEKELREEVAKVEAKNRWFSDFKTFIEEVAAFLDEKCPPLEKIEEDNLAIQRERYDIVSRRRYADDSDDVSLFTGAIVAPTFSLLPTSPLPEELDEFGRTVENVAAPRSAVRVARRAARERRVTTRANTGDDNWSDDELGEGDSADMADALTSLRESLSGLFGDVKADDFRDPDLGIKSRFEAWRGRFGEEYANAFGGLALVGVWEFWARVEMALWNPFEIAQLAKTPSGLDAYRWHSSLGAFGHSGQVDEGEADESEVVVNALVTSVVIPRLEKLARQSFDPLSRKQTARALALVDEVSYCVERSSPKFEALIQSFLFRIQSAVTHSQSLVAPNLTAIALPQNAFDPSTFAVRNRFALRQVKLLQNAVRWRRYAKTIRLSAIEEGVGAGGTLDELLVRELVAKVLLPIVEAGWSTGGDEVARKVLALLPADVIPPALRRRLEGER